jgi:uncharacterized membrane protein
LRQVVKINTDITDNKITFKWTFIILPVVLFFISLILTAIFYQQLPTQVAYHFQDDSPDRWLSRGAFAAWLLIPQLLFTVLAFIVVKIILSSARYWPAENKLMRRLLPVMGNMVALPQIILTFAMLDIFLYNAYEIRLIPIWVFTIIIMVFGAIILGIFFYQTIREARRQRGKTHQE